MIPRIALMDDDTTAADMARWCTTTHRPIWEFADRGFRCVSCGLLIIDEGAAPDA